MRTFENADVDIVDEREMPEVVRLHLPRCPCPQMKIVVWDRISYLGRPLWRFGE